MLGFLNINKPSGISSSAVVSKIRKKLMIKKIGHMGTLDPLASGVLPIAVGKATRLFDYFLNKNKKYYAEFEFGYETSTLDSEGEIVKKSNFIPTKEDILNVLDRFIGKISQMPPNFSAKKVNGVSAYNLARKNVEIDLKPSIVEIFELKFIDQLSHTKFAFEITCGSGTYIRSIARDLGVALNTFGTMTKLIRVKSGDGFLIENAIELENFIQLDNPNDLLIKCDDVFKFDKYDLTDKEYIDVRNGLKTCFIKPFEKDTFLYHNSRLIGVAENGINYLKVKVNLE